MASLMPLGKQQYFSASGAPLVGGKVYTYAAGTTTPLATYSDKAGTTPNTNPVILDSRGEATIFWGSAGYKVVLKDATDVTVWTQDNLYGSADQGDLLAYETAVAASGGSALVGFIQSGTGAVARTVQDKGREFKSILDFFADPTGVADSTAAVQMAITFCATYGYNLYAPGGIYRLSSGISMPNKSGFCFYGDGWSTIDGSFNTESGTRFYYYGTGTAFTITGTALDTIDNVHLDSFSIENKSGATGSTIGLHIEYARWNEFDNLYVQGFDIGIDHNHLTWMNHFKGCVSMNNATYGINNQSDGEDSLFETCFTRYNGVAGVIVNQAKNDTFVCCDFANNPKGLVIYGANSGSAAQVTCIGCIWEDNATYCIDINTAGLSAPYYPVLNVIGGRMYNSGIGGSVAISAVVWNQINIIGTESNFATFVDTTRGSGTYGPVFIQGVKLAAGNIKFNGNSSVLRSADDTRTAIANGSMANSWINNPSNTVTYYKDASNYVHLSGELQGGVIGSYAFILPAGYRPAIGKHFAASSNGAFGQCYVDAVGVFTPQVGTNIQVSLDGISFFAEQ